MELDWTPWLGDMRQNLAELVAPTPLQDWLDHDMEHLRNVLMQWYETCPWETSVSDIDMLVDALDALTSLRVSGSPPQRIDTAMPKRKYCSKVCLHDLSLPQHLVRLQETLRVMEEACDAANHAYVPRTFDWAWARIRSLLDSHPLPNKKGGVNLEDLD